jgi:hypothetical protein
MLPVHKPPRVVGWALAFAMRKAKAPVFVVSLCAHSLVLLLLLVCVHRSLGRT